ncbi:hypothetical protein MRB53_039687 [Persea americana]|nr:hypothetical protein MRB53_039687 [Persea americana]
MRSVDECMFLRLSRRDPSTPPHAERRVSDHDVGRMCCNYRDSLSRSLGTCNQSDPRTRGHLCATLAQRAITDAGLDAQVDGCQAACGSKDLLQVNNFINCDAIVSRCKVSRSRPRGQTAHAHACWRRAYCARSIPPSARKNRLLPAHPCVDIPRSLPRTGYQLAHHRHSLPSDGRKEPVGASPPSRTGEGASGRVSPHHHRTPSELDTVVLETGGGQCATTRVRR